MKEFENLTTKTKVIIAVSGACIILLGGFAINSAMSSKKTESKVETVKTSEHTRPDKTDADTLSKLTKEISALSDAEGDYLIATISQGKIDLVKKKVKGNYSKLTELDNDRLDKKVSEVQNKFDNLKKVNSYFKTQVLSGSTVTKSVIIDGLTEDKIDIDFQKLLGKKFHRTIEELVVDAKKQIRKRDEDKKNADATKANVEAESAKSDQSQVAEAQQTEAVVSQQVQAQATYTAPAETTSATISNTASTPSNTNASASVTTPVTPIPTVSNDQKWTNAGYIRAPYPEGSAELDNWLMDRGYGGYTGNGEGWIRPY